MAILVATIGGLNILLGLAGLLFPAYLMQWAARLWRTEYGAYLAISLRVFMSALLIAGAPYCRWPLALQIIGWLSLVEALAAALQSRERFTQLLEWILSRPASFIRGGAGIGMLFGVLILYAAGYPGG
ncbi:hypothetical protein [Methylogaea oryzae]|uniref:Uncharacterized protein n=1 Tax=Methylogaea oryzae TaxID=1295382 RepID=A0A8D4VPD0_9GAMM|nr:hypothetical protein [Methylogaea oryzae]BBL71316.1 hypothetical protein MoryE10_19220 [Methylogaea oryzae]